MEQSARCSTDLSWCVKVELQVILDDSALPEPAKVQGGELCLCRM